ncbi:MAG TPA: anhydro-N-acetylmuramic acid kinase [Candidatus Kapabacteria bacterium]|nr:anhydro-N-acetylmuramic acid kinase [Candidatus Kapabacteria bacterium]
MDNQKIIIGIMTGTSVDSVDVALCKFYTHNENFKFEVLHSNEYRINKEIRELIFRIIGNNFTIKELSQLNFYLAHLFNDYSRKICSEINLDFNLIDAISIHGQTLWHNPIAEPFADKIVASTLQLTSISALSSLTGTKVIGDFRSADVALGGQGAPLVPIFDYHFLKSKINNVVALNIGGIANVTIIPTNSDFSNIIAFDTGAGNMLIDLATKKYFNKNYDSNGEIAQSGKIIEVLFNKLKEIEFTYLKAPKSTGRELFNEELLHSLIQTNYLPNDIIRTLTEFTAFSIAYNIIKYAPIHSNIIVSGGGAKNIFLINTLKTLLDKYTITKIDNIGINGDAKEAICFAFLGYLNIMKIKLDISHITGAKSHKILGISSY